MEPARRTLRWVDLLPVLIFAVLGGVLVVAILVGIARTNRAFATGNAETIGLLATLALYLAVGAGIAVALRRLRAPIEYLRLRLPTLRDLVITVALLLPWYIGIALVSALSARLLNGGNTIPGNSRLVFIQRPHGIGLLILALLVTAVAAPVCEELFFRGMLFRLLEERTVLWLAVVISALAFGLAHASPAINLALLPTFVYMGAVLALVYVKTGWLSNSMLLHGLNNAIVTILAFNVALR